MSDTPAPPKSEPHSVVIEHRASYGRRQCGMTSISPSRPLYCTTVICDCGWHGKVNAAPSKGGNKDAKSLFERHAKTAVIPMSEADLRSMIETLRQNGRNPTRIALHPSVAMTQGARELARRERIILEWST